MVIVFLALTILLITVGTAFSIGIHYNVKLPYVLHIFAVICVTKPQGIKTKIVLLVYLLGMLSLIFLVVFSIITGVQQGKFLLS